MQYVRCEKCGAKALFAASRCPKCTHPFYLRDHRGELIALTHCRSCDTWFSREVGHCKWCGGEKVQRPALGGSLGILALVAVLAIGGFAWWRFRSTPTPVGAITEAAVQPVAPPVVVAPPVTDSVLPLDTISQTIDSIPLDVRVDSSLVATPVPVPVPSTSTTGTEVWRSATATTYINVRAAPDRKAPVVGVVQPDAKVEVGPLSRGWRQIRAPGISGWVDPRNLRP